MTPGRPVPAANGRGAGFAGIPRRSVLLLFLFDD